MKPGTPGFIGKRLTEAREARGLSTVALADLLEVTRQTVNKYENGTQSPSPEIFSAICRQVNVPRQFFLSEPLDEAEVEPIFYRSNASATKAARARAERRFVWLKSVFRFLSRSMKFPECNFPDFDVPSDPQTLSMDEVEEFAAKTRRHWNLGDGPIANVVALLENNGAIVSRHELGADKLDAFSQWSKALGRPFIVLGEDKASAVRSRFDAAHELAHLILHRHLSRETAGKKGVFPVLEEQAHRFAAAFLLPARSFIDSVVTPQLDIFRSQKSRWRVSIALMIMRSGQLDMASEDQLRRLWINRTRRGWRTKEPLDESIEPERPRMLRRSFEIMMAHGVLQPENLMIDLGLNFNDIEQLCNLESGVLTGKQDDVGPEPRIISISSYRSG